MYISALKSSGITAGHVYVTSPVEATGESALAGIMNSYEEVTDVKIPDTVKEAANNEIYTQAEIVKNSNVDAEKPVLRMLWSADGEHFCDSTCRFVPVDHTWVGAKIGIFALSDQGAETGYADFLSVRVTELM